MKQFTRRDMLKMTGSALAGATILDRFPAMAQDKGSKTEKQKALVIGAHPDDPETGCGGTMILLKRAGWEIVSVYLTRGEAGIAGKNHNEAAAIRVKEVENACKVTGARHIFMNQIDGNTEVNRQRYAEMKELIANEKPDVVFTHWPIDSHRDHAVCAQLVLDAWRHLNHSFKLYYFEVMTGTQSQLFNPTDHVNIDQVVELKRKACYCHESQGMEAVYNGWHDTMERFRGIEARCKYAEAFVHIPWEGNSIVRF